MNYGKPLALLVLAGSLGLGGQHALAQRISPEDVYKRWNQQVDTTRQDYSKEADRTSQNIKVKPIEYSKNFLDMSIR